MNKYDRALEAYEKAILLRPNKGLYWFNKGDALKELGRTSEAEAAYAKASELGYGNFTSTNNVMTANPSSAPGTFVEDHIMANNVDESTNNVITRAYTFSSTDSKAYSWLSLGKAGNGTVKWMWYSPDGNLYRTETVDIPTPSGDYWRSYNVWSYIYIAGDNAANRPGDWHVDVFLDGRKMLTEYFSISGGQKTTAPENQYQYNLKGEGRYDEAVNFYDEAINSDPNNFQNWKALNSKGEALFKQGKYEEALQAYDKAIELAPDISIVWTNKGHTLKALGRADESDVAYATARELGDYSEWVPETNATGINLSSLYFIEIFDHCMASGVDKSANDVITRSNTFSSTDSKIYSWLNLGHVLGATVTWHWYSPDGNPYKTGHVNIDRNPKGGYYSSYNVWDSIDVPLMLSHYNWGESNEWDARRSAEEEGYSYYGTNPNPDPHGDWTVDVYLNDQWLLQEQFTVTG